jgi:hypothetical protein
MLHNKESKNQIMVKNKYYDLDSCHNRPGDLRIFPGTDTIHEEPGISNTRRFFTRQVA